MAAKPPPPPRTLRSAAEMVEQLRVQAQLLREHLARVDAGEYHYLGEIADKLRLLVCEARSNKALLQRIGKLVDGTPMVTIDGPPGWTFLGGRKHGDRITLDQWLDDPSMAVRTPSGGGKAVMMTRRELILIWAQQDGGTHADWSIDERYQTMGEHSGFMASEEFARMAGPLAGLFLGRPTMLERQLLEIAAVVLVRCEKLLSWLTPARVAQAEKRLAADRT